jgi:hypothetical protein
MSETKSASRQWISLRVKPEEYQVIYGHYQKTTCNKLSEYVRKVLLNKPVKIQHYDQSTTEMLAAFNQLKNELNAIGNNFNQSVKTLHTLKSTGDIQTWALLNESSKQVLFNKIEEIRLFMKTIIDQWCRK